MSNEYPQPVEPMSRAEEILRGNTSTVPMSRIEALLKQLVEGGGGGSTVTITTDYQAGTKIATLTIDDTPYNIYIPTDQIGSIVSISTDYQEGTKIATLTIDDTPYNIYIPADQVGNLNFVGTDDPSAAVGNDKDLYFKVTTETNTETLYTETWEPRTFGTVMAIQYSNVVSAFDMVTVNIHNSGNLVFNYSDLPVSDDPVNDGYAWHDEWNYAEFKISRDATNIYFTVTRWEGQGVWVFQTCSIAITTVDTVDKCFIKDDGAWHEYTPIDISVTQVVSSGVKLATITINDSPVDIYAPNDVVGARTYKGLTDPSSDLGNDGDIYYKCDADTVDVYTLIDPSELPAECKFESSSLLTISLPADATKIKLNCHKYNESSTEIILNISDIPTTNNRPYSQGAGINVLNNLYMGKDSTHIYFEEKSGTYTWIASGYFGFPEYTFTKVIETFVKTSASWMPVEDKTGTTTYSTNWVLVDKWIDNSNIYRKVIDLGSMVNFPADSAVELDTYLGTDADNISQIINLRGVLVNDAGTNQNGCGNFGFVYSQNGNSWLAYATNLQSYFTHLVIDAVLTTEPS